LLAPISQDAMPMVVVDLEGVDYFGSSFLSLLLRCWKAVLVKGGQMVLAGVSPRARELLRITSLDIVWPIYSDRSEALAALQSDWAHRPAVSVEGHRVRPDDDTGWTERQGGGPDRRDAMGIYDRDYIQDRPGGFGALFGGGSAVKTLILINVAVFLFGWL